MKNISTLNQFINEGQLNELSDLANKADKFILLCDLISEKSKFNKDAVIEELKNSNILSLYKTISSLTQKMILL